LLLGRGMHRIPPRDRDIRIEVMGRALTPAASAAGTAHAWRPVMSTLANTLAALLAVLFVACAPSQSPGGGDDSPDAGFTDPGDDDECEPDFVPAPAGQACAAATQTCMDACADDACWEACLTADPDAENCGTCLEDGYIACVNEAGCQSAWDTVACCFDGCDDPDSAACETECEAESTDYDACIETYDDACYESTNTACFKAT
jgi:hypothetical protein